MHKWVIHFTDGKRATLLSGYCSDIASATEAAIERFGAARIDSVTDGDAKPVEQPHE